jgi:signal peptidase II
VPRSACRASSARSGTDTGRRASSSNAEQRALSTQPPVETRSSRRYVLTVLAVAATVIVIDRLTKIWAVDALADGRVIVLFEPWWQLRLVYNPGAAFGFAGGYTVVISLVAMVVVVAILRMSRRLTNVWWAVALGGILGGALGNLIDRMTQEPAPFRGFVIDFIEWPGFPVWNLADAAIVGSVALVFVLSLRNIPYDATTSDATGEQG